MKKIILQVFGAIFFIQMVFAIIIIARAVWLGCSNYGLKVSIANFLVFWGLSYLAIKIDKRKNE
ncbi:hypothetical protein [Tenacibaculum maritimum]|uniref:hypothetical protein n=1 Tax=Tenacibaculum maritimum TaxID=107401 RepID=UPI003875C3DA